MEKLRRKALFASEKLYHPVSPDKRRQDCHPSYPGGEFWHLSSQSAATRPPVRVVFQRPGAVYIDKAGRHGLAHTTVTRFDTHVSRFQATILRSIYLRIITARAGGYTAF
jgi:hypothetical protein